MLMFKENKIFKKIAFLLFILYNNIKNIAKYFSTSYINYNIKSYY